MNARRRGSYGDEPEERLNRDTGRMGFRWPEDPPDGRPVINQRPFWEDPEEQAVYEQVVKTHPRWPTEGSMAYIQRVAELAAGRLPKPAKPVPKENLTRKAFQKRLAELEVQREVIREPGEEG